MSPVRPKMQACPECGPNDDDLSLDFVIDEWVFRCTYRGHPPLEWRPTPDRSAVGSYRSGLGVELGVYDDLLECVVDGWAEYGVIEHRYSELNPTTYRQLVARYGHRSKEPSAYTVSSFLGGALGQLWREKAVEGRWGPATGLWKSNGQTGTYAPLGTPDGEPILSWADFADQTLGVSEQAWPAIP